MSEEVPLEIREVRTGTKVFDWTVPDEWNIEEAFIEDESGNRIVDFRDNNLHVVSYSQAVDSTMTLDELKPHLFTLPEQPNWVPYRTAYYDRNWGFCLPHEQLQRLAKGSYRVRIDSRLEPGSLTYGEILIPGRLRREILVWSHCCHPSLCNDNLSGLAVSVWWAKHLLESQAPRFSYRFVWAPGTIGSICWLAQNQKQLDRICGGLVTVLLGRPGPFHYKRSRSGNAMIDRVVQRVLKKCVENAVFRDFDPYGYDERQFGSPRIDLPVGRLTRVPNGEYPEYHTSADNMELIDAGSLQEALTVCIEISQEIESADIFSNLSPCGEPQLGKRGLYRQTGGDDIAFDELSMLWVLNQSDGSHSLVDISEKSGLSLEALHRAAEALVEAGLLERL
jgi:aminopeptidase-like protein